MWENCVCRPPPVRLRLVCTAQLFPWAHWGQSLLFLLKFGIALAFFSFFLFLLFVMDVNRDSLFLGGMLTNIYSSWL